MEVTSFCGGTAAPPGENSHRWMAVTKRRSPVPGWKAKTFMRTPRLTMGEGKSSGRVGAWPGVEERERRSW